MTYLIDAKMDRWIPRMEETAQKWIITQDDDPETYPTPTLNDTAQLACDVLLLIEQYKALRERL
jgi:hypothetical protein